MTANTRASLIDRIYGSLANGTDFFQDGWGRLDGIREFAASSPDRIEPHWETESLEDGCHVRHARFESPFCAPAFPAVCTLAEIEFILPARWSYSTPVCIQFAATGDQGFERRRRSMALPLVKRGIGSLLLENAYYGTRRPSAQQGKALRTFADLWMMGTATVREGLSLLRWLREQGFTRLGVTGISMGGHMAASVAALWPEPLAVSPCIAPHSAQVVFTEGLLSRHCAWEVLKDGRENVQDAVVRMRELLGVTDLTRYPPPPAPHAAVLVSAGRDAYIPAWSPTALHEHWKGSTLRWLNTGHVTSFIFKRASFQDAVADSLATLSGDRVTQ